MDNLSIDKDELSFSSDEEYSFSDDEPMSPKKKRREFEPAKIKKEKPKKLQMKDKILLNDLQAYYKEGTFPFLFVCQILSTLIVTYIIVKETHSLNGLMEHTRAMQSVFYNHDDTADPDYDLPRTYYLTTLSRLNEHISDEINQIFDVDNNLVYNISFLNMNDLKMEVTYKKMFDKDKSVEYPFEFPINDSSNNPLEDYFGEDNYYEMQKFLSMTSNLKIVLNYEYDRLNCDVCENIKLTLNYDTSRIGYIKFKTLFDYKNCDSNYNNITLIKNGFNLANSYLNSLNVLLAAVEIIMIIVKTVSIAKIVLQVKAKLQCVESIDKFTSEDIYLKSGKTKWDLIKMKDIYSLFPVWLVLLLLGSVFQIVAGILYIQIPFLTQTNIIFFGFTALFSWISLAYYFRSHSSYFSVYRTLYKSMGEYKYLLTTFIFLFTGFTLFHMAVFDKEDKWYDGCNTTFLTLFAATFGDLLIDIWGSTLRYNPITTMVFAFILFILFLGNHIRVMFTITQESFQIANLEKNKNWLENKLSFNDYLSQKFATNPDSRKCPNNFVIDDIWMRALINQDDVNKLLNVDLDLLKIKGYDVKEIKKYLNKFKNEEKRKNISEEVYKSITHENDKDETIVMSGEVKEIKNMFLNIKLLFRKIKAEYSKDKSSVDQSGINISRKCESYIDTLKKAKELLDNSDI